MKKIILILFFLLSLTGTAFAASCMTVICDSSGNLDAGYIGTGTIDAARLPFSISDSTYSGDWNGATTACPTANAVYDKIETLGAPAGDIEAVWAGTSGVIDALTAAAGDSLDAALADYAKPCVHLTDCTGVTGEGRCCWDTDSDTLCYGTGVVCSVISSATMTVGNAVTGGTVNTILYKGADGNLGSEAALAYDASTNTVTADVFTTSGSDPRLNASNSDGPASPTAGDIWIDTTATYGQLGFYDAAVSVIDPRVLLPLSYPSPVGSTSQIVAKMPYGVVIRSINCIIDPSGTGESVVIYLEECDSAGDNCAGIDGATTITCGNAGAADDGSLSNATVDANDWIKINFDAVTGTVSTLGVTVVYTVVNE